ncbi:MAG: DUF4476 domain-containing protein, partial [Bacteroidales bacterium]|nr:DUF4476 domain-containing protein [Bacteroidales bacterium]
MKQILLSVAFCLFTLLSLAQSNDYVFYTDNGVKFTVYLNNVKQNSVAAANVKAENVSGKNISVKIVFEPEGIPTLNKSLVITNTNKQLKYQLVKGRENVYSMNLVSTTEKSSSSSVTTVVKGDNSGSTEDKSHSNNNNHGGYNNNNNGHGNNNNGHGGYNNNNNGHGGYGNNNGHGGYNNGGHYGNNHGYGNNNGYGNGGYGNNGYAPSDNPRCYMSMTTNDFNSLRRNISTRPYESSRLAIAKQACLQNCMTSDQIAELCRIFAYESTKLDFAKYAYAYCYDRYRY